MLFGSTQYNPPSRFLKEIPEHLTAMVEGGRQERAGSIRAGRDQIVDAAMRDGPAPPGTRHGRRPARALASATTWSTASGARA